MKRIGVMLVLAVLLAACSDQGVMRVTLQAESYSVPAHVDYVSLRLHNVTNTSRIDLVEYEVHATCTEHTFESLTHVFNGTFSLKAGGTADILVPYERGYPRFAGRRVACRIEVPTKLGQAMVTLNFN